MSVNATMYTLLEPNEWEQIKSSDLPIWFSFISLTLEMAILGCLPIFQTTAEGNGILPSKRHLHIISPVLWDMTFQLSTADSPKLLTIVET